MASDLFNQINRQQQGFNPSQFMQELSQLKSQGGDPNQMIQQLLNSGRVTQSQVNMAMSRAQQIMRMLPLGGRR